MSCLTHLGFSSYKRKSIQSLYWDFGLLWVNRAYSEYITFLTKVSVVNAVILPVVMYRCESWTIKKVEHQRIDAFKLVLEKTLESPLDSKEIKTVRPKGNQLWIFNGRTDAEAETPILQPPDAKSWLIGKADSSFPDAGKDWRQKGEGVAEDEMVRWHHRFNGHEFEQTPGEVTDREAGRAAVLEIGKSWTRLSNRTTAESGALLLCIGADKMWSHPEPQWKAQPSHHTSTVVQKLREPVLLRAVQRSLDISADENLTGHGAMFSQFTYQQCTF